MRKEVVAAAIIKNGLVLILWKNKRHHYEFPGGLIEQGEQRESALKREVLEEVGCEITNMQYHSQYKYRVGVDDFKIHMYTGEIQKQPKISADFDHFVWMSIKQFQSYKLAPNVLDFCRKF